nr:unnamed protein product [Digitaria exilis]
MALLLRSSCDDRRQSSCADDRRLLPSALMKGRYSGAPPMSRGASRCGTSAQRLRRSHCSARSGWQPCDCGGVPFELPCFAKATSVGVPSRVRPVRRHARPSAVRPCVPGEARLAAARRLRIPCPRMAARTPAGHATPFFWPPWLESPVVHRRRPSTGVNEEAWDGKRWIWMDEGVRLGTTLSSPPWLVAAPLTPPWLRVAACWPATAACGWSEVGDEM